jgi:hypothetical protein
METQPGKSIMHNNHTRLRSVLLSLAAAAMLVHVSAVPAADDHLALAGFSEAKIAFELKDGEGKALLARLDMIDETRQSLIQQGFNAEKVLPQIRVVGSGFISLMAYQAKGRSYIAP